MIKKVMLSQPMAGKTDEEIVAIREHAVHVLESRGYEVVNTLFTDEWYRKEAMESRGVVQIPLCFLAKSLENMSLCHAAYFCRGWENARGCRIEHEAAKAYGLEIIYEDDADASPTIEPQRWIPASEPPKEYRDKYGELIPFLVCEDGTEYPFRAMYDGKCWGDGIYAVPVKWWMPLPEPPKED